MIFYMFKSLDLKYNYKLSGYPELWLTSKLLQPPKPKSAKDVWQEIWQLKVITWVLLQVAIHPWSKDSHWLCQS